MKKFISILLVIISMASAITLSSCTTADTIEEGVYICTKAVITSGCTVGKWANISVGSVVMDDVRPNSTVFGIPAQEIE